MCGRYFIDLDEPELARIAGIIEEEIKERQLSFPVKTAGEIFPTDTVPVQTGTDSFQPMKWGFTGYDRKLIINARSETALGKPLFKEAMRIHRCLLPASGYYEWEGVKGKKQRYAFTLPGGPLYLAGCFRQEQGLPFPSFVILTREAAPALAHIHSRMPVIIPQDQAESWLTRSSQAMEEPILDLLAEASEGFQGRK